MGDPVLDKLSAEKWRFAGQDDASLTELRRRLISAARRRDTITYGKLVEGIRFHIGTINEGLPFEIDPHEWSELDRGMIGDFLGCISAATYRKHGFLLSAIAVGKSDGSPSDHFFRWAIYLGLLRDLKESSRLEFWVDQVRRIHDHYGVKNI